MILVVAIGAPLALFAWRAPSSTPGAPFEPVSRETGILVNNLLLTVAAATVFVGTLYPLLLDALEGVKISVGPPYFTYLRADAGGAGRCVPFGPMLAWRRGAWGERAHAARGGRRGASWRRSRTAALVSPRRRWASLASRSPPG